MTEDTYKPMDTAEFSATCSALGLDADWVARKFKVDSGTVLNWFDGYGVIPAKVGKGIREVVNDRENMEKAALVLQTNPNKPQNLLIDRRNSGKYPKTFYRILAYQISKITGAEIVWKNDK